MKFSVIFFAFFTATNLHAAEFRPEIAIDKINLLKNPKSIFTELKKLEKDNLSYKASIIKKKEYNAVAFHYTLTLEQLLKQIPDSFDQVPSCKTLQSQILNAYKDDWNNLPTPTHHIWHSFNKLCLK